MSAGLLGSDALRALKPLEVASYLRVHGWRQEAPDYTGKRAEAQLPMAPEQEGTADSPQTSELDAGLAAMRDRWMRAEAEIANIRARAKRDVDEARQFAVQKFATDVVEAAENLRRGLASIPQAVAGEPEIVKRLRDGFIGVERNFIDLLKRNGIEKGDPTGSPFDPKLHQAMAEQETGSHDPGTVLHALSAVWTLNGRLLRPAWSWLRNRSSSISSQACLITENVDDAKRGCATSPPPRQHKNYPDGSGSRRSVTALTKRIWFCCKVWEPAALG